MSRRQQRSGGSKQGQDFDPSPNTTAIPPKPQCGELDFTHLVLSRRVDEGIELYAAGQLIGVIRVFEIHENFIKCDYFFDQRIHVCREELPESVKIKAGVQRRKKLKEKEKLKEKKFVA